MTARLRTLAFVWALLLALLALERGLYIGPSRGAGAWLALAPATLMIGLVAVAFMEIGRGPTIVRIFAAAGLLWLSILLGLGSVDPATRTLYPVHGVEQKQ